MTDTSNDTASGGLENDMPGIGNAPSSPRMVPQGLGGLVGAFSKMFQGAPAPRAPGVGRSPWRQPGQSQVKPPDPHAPRWEGTTASLYLPKGSNQPPATFSPFRGTMPKGDYRNWGQPEEYPDLPESHEIPGIYRGLGQFFSSPGQGGSGASVPLAFALTGHANDYIQGLMKGQEFRAKMAREQMIDSAMRLQLQQEAQHTTYADRMRQYFEMAGENKAKAGTITIKGVSLMDALHNDALQLNDPDIANMIEGGATVDQIMRFQDFRDAKLKDLQKANAKAQEQEEKDAEVRKEYGIPEPTGGHKSSTDPFAPSTPEEEPRPEPTEGAVPSSPQPGGKQAPTMVAGGPDPNAPSPDATPAEGDAARPTPKPYEEVGDQIAKGEATLNSQPGAARPAIEGRIAQQGIRLNKIKDDIKAGRIKQEDIPAALDKVFPGMSDDYNNAYRGSPIPPGVQGRSLYWQTIRSLAVPDPVTQQATIKDFATSGKSGTRLSAGGRMGTAAITVLEAAKNIPEGESVPAAVVDQWIASNITGDPKWSGMFNALNTYIQDAQSLQSPTGRFFVTEVEDLKRNLKTTQGLRAVRTFLQQDAENSLGLATQLVREYQHGAQRPGEFPTSYDEPSYSILKDISRIDPVHGFEGVTVHPELKGLGLGKTGSDSGSGFKLPEGVTITPIQ